MRALSCLAVLLFACGDDSGGSSDGPAPPDGPDAAPAAPSILVAGGAGTFQAENDVAAAGDLVVIAFMDQRESSVVGAENPGVIRVAVSRDGGRTFGAPRAIDDSRDVDQFDPTVALGADGRTHVGWFEDDGAGARHVRVATAADPDGAFTLAAPLDDGVDAVDRPWIALQPNGDVAAIWVAAPGHELHFTRSTDGGATFVPEVASPEGGFMSGCLAAAPDGSLFVVLDQYEGSFVGAPRVLAARSTDGGLTFDPPVVMGTRSRPGRVIARCAVDPTATPARLAVVWAERTGLDDVASPTLIDADLWLGTTDGVVATTPQAVPVPIGSVPLAVPPPAIAIDAAGATHVFFYARRAGGATHDADWEAFLASAPPSQGLAAPRPLSPAPFPGTRIYSVSPPEIDITRWLGDTEGVAAPTGALVPVWSESRDGDADLFAARL